MKEQEKEKERERKDFERQVLSFLNTQRQRNRAEENGDRELLLHQVNLFASQLQEKEDHVMSLMADIRTLTEELNSRNGLLEQVKQEKILADSALSFEKNKNTELKKQMEFQKNHQKNDPSLNSHSSAQGFPLITNTFHLVLGK